MRSASLRATASLPMRGQPRPPRRDHRHRVLGPAHDPGLGAHVIGHDPVAALARRLAVAWAITSSVSAAKPTTSAGRCGMARHGGQNVGVLGKLQRGGRPDPSFFIFDPAALATRQSATAAAITRRIGGQAASTAASICARFPPAPPPRPAAAAPWPGRSRRSPARPDRAAPPPSPCPAPPTTGWRYSAPGRWVHASGPRSPAHAAPPAARAQRRPIAATISSGSAIRPGPNSPQAMSPSFGPTVSTPSPCSAPGCAGSPGAPTSAHSSRARSAPLVGRHQQGRGQIIGMPARHLGHQIGGAGATTTRSAARDSWIWPISASSVRSNRS
jgi:hypothetical protein